MNVTECLLKITELTTQNLNILKALNESFYSKQAYITTDISGTKYVIPSFLNLENKVNHLQDAMDNLINAAKSGSAWMNFDGNSKEIQLAGFQQSPNPITLPEVNNFGVEAVNLFKDMVSPKPYITFNLKDLPDNITKVVVKKVVLYNSDLINRVLSETGDNIQSAKFSYIKLAEILSNFESKDYLEYSTTYDMPIRQAICDGDYIISEVVSDVIDSNLDNYITVKFDDSTPPVYRKLNEYNTNTIEVGCKLTTYDGSCMLEVTDIQPSTHILKLKVLHGSYVHLIANTTPTTGDDVISDYSRLRFYSPADNVISTDKTLHIPLEEDKYVFIAVAPLNSTINVQSMWDDGLFFITDNLLSEDNTTNFRTYYTNNVKNIGDSLSELTTLMSPSITKYTTEQFNEYTKTSPDNDDIVTNVVQINKHLNDSDTVKNIRNLYSQKQQYKTDLTEVQNKIATLTSELAEISFDDLSGTRSMYTAQITDLKKKQNELTTSIGKIMDSIAQAANDSEVPLENGKYRIRGYVDVEQYIKDYVSQGSLDEVIGIQVQYRYKNPNIPQANVNVIKDYLFTEWNDYNPPKRQRVMSYDASTGLILKYTDIDDGGKFKSTENVPKYNQIDIPINQGESVDIRVRVLWAFGYPFTQITSDWSEIQNIPFPEELVQDIQVTTIIEENNSDIETNRFNQILNNNGITTHVDDAVQDQDITYFHKPENISSGFYTNERRIIPLKDKLVEISNNLTNIQDTIEGTSTDAMKVSMVLDGVIHELQPSINNNIHLAPYSSIVAGQVASGESFKSKEGGPVQLIGLIKIQNTTNHTLNIFSIYPASRSMNIQDIVETRRKYNLNDYYGNNLINPNLVSNETERGPLIGYVSNIAGQSNKTKQYYNYQSGNQFIYFRLRNPFDNSILDYTPMINQRGIYNALGGVTIGNKILGDEIGSQAAYKIKLELINQYTYILSTQTSLTTNQRLSEQTYSFDSTITWEYSKGLPVYNEKGKIIYITDTNTPIYILTESNNNDGTYTYKDIDGVIPSFYRLNKDMDITTESRSDAMKEYTLSITSNSENNNYYILSTKPQVNATNTLANEFKLPYLGSYTNNNGGLKVYSMSGNTGNGQWIDFPTIGTPITTTIYVCRRNNYGANSYGYSSVMQFVLNSNTNTSITVNDNNSIDSYVLTVNINQTGDYILSDSSMVSTTNVTTFNASRSIKWNNSNGLSVYDSMGKVKSITSGVSVYLLKKSNNNWIVAKSIILQNSNSTLSTDVNDTSYTNTLSIFTSNDAYNNGNLYSIIQSDSNNFNKRLNPITWDSDEGINIVIPSIRTGDTVTVYQKIGNDWKEAISDILQNIENQVINVPDLYDTDAYKDEMNKLIVNLPYRPADGYMFFIKADGTEVKAADITDNIKTQLKSASSNYCKALLRWTPDGTIQDSAFGIIKINTDGTITVLDKLDNTITDLYLVRVPSTSLTKYTPGTDVFINTINIGADGWKSCHKTVNYDGYNYTLTIKTTAPNIYYILSSATQAYSQYDLSWAAINGDAVIPFTLNGGYGICYIDANGNINELKNNDNSGVLYLLYSLDGRNWSKVTDQTMKRTANTQTINATDKGNFNIYRKTDTTTQVTGYRLTIDADPSKQYYIGDVMSIKNTTKKLTFAGGSTINWIDNMPFTNQSDMADVINPGSPLILLKETQTSSGYNYEAESFIILSQNNQQVGGGSSTSLFTKSANSTTEDTTTDNIINIETTTTTSTTNSDDSEIIDTSYQLPQSNTDINTWTDTYWPDKGIFVGPYINKMYELCLKSDDLQSSQSIGPGESISIPILILYKLQNTTNMSEVSYTIGFDVRNSLYNDPVYYQVTLNARYNQSLADTLSSQKASVNTLTKYNITTR